MMRNGSSARVACAWSQSSLFSIARPMVSGYMWSLPVAGSLGGASGRGRRQARVHGWGRGGRGYDQELRVGRRSRLAFFALLDQLLDGYRIGGWLDRHRPRLVDSRLVHFPIGVPGHEGFRHVERGHGLSYGNRPHDFGCDDDQQFGIVALDGFAGEQLAEQRDVGQTGDLVDGLRQGVVQQAGDHKALSALEFHFGLDAARAHGGDGSAGEDDRVAEVKRTDFRGNLQLDGPAGRDAGQEFDTDTELAEGDGDCIAPETRLNHGEWDLAAGEEAGLLAIDGQKIRLGQGFEQILALQRLDGRRQVNVLAEQQDAQHVGEANDAAGADGGTGELSGADGGGLVKSSGSETDTQVQAGGAVHTAETHPQQDLLLHRGNLHPQQVDGFGRKRGRNRHDAVGGDHVFYRATHKCRLVFESDVDIFVGEIARQLLPHRIELHGAQTHGQVVEQAVATLLPDDQRSLAGGLAVDQDFLGIDGDGFDELAVGHRDALDLVRAIDDQALADGDHQLARRGGQRDFLRLGVFIAAGAADRGVPKPEGRHHDTCKAKTPHLLTSVLPPNFCSRLLFPEMISMTKGISFGGGAAATTGSGRFGTARGRAAALSDGSGANLPLVKRRWSAVPGVLAISWSIGLRRTNWMLVELAARLSCSACVGVTSMLTTCTAMGLPSLSFLKSWPAESTSIFCSKVWVRVPWLLLPPGELPEIRMSTCVPGTTKPATPTTSLTRTATARIPGGIMAAMPPPAPFAARREAITGSLAKMAVMTPRPIMSFTWLVEPAGTAPGQSATLTSSSFNTVPTSRSLVARATCDIAGPALVVGVRLISTR